MFAIKITAIGLVILCGFGGIQFLHINPLLAISNACFALDAGLAYNILYDRGFAIPRQFGALKKLIVLKMRLKLAQERVDCRNRMLEVVKGVKAVRVMGVRVGAFHYLQRLSTPNFFDFCTKNLVRLFVAFQGLN